MDEYRADVRKRLEETAKEKAEGEMQNEAVDKAVENAEFEVPAAMIDNQVDNMIRDFANRLSYQGMNLDMYIQYTGQTLDGLKAAYRPQAEKQVNAGLVLDAIAKAEGIEVSPEELELNLVDMSKKYNMELDKMCIRDRIQGVTRKDFN